MQGELSAIGELVLCGTQIIVPKQLSSTEVGT